MVQEAHLRLSVVCCVLTAHLRHLPPMSRRGVEMSCARGASWHLDVIVSDRMCQFSVNDGVRDVTFPCWWVLSWRNDRSTCPRWEFVSVVNGVRSFPVGWY